MDEARIKLAEAMGWRRVEEGTNAWWPSPKVVEQIKQQYPDAIAIDYVGLDSLPDPFTDANDCEALIQHLNSLGWQVEIHWQHTSDENLAAGSWIHIWQHGTEIHHRADIDVDRWKIMVCNIALAILEPTGATETVPDTDT